MDLSLMHGLALWCLCPVVGCLVRSLCTGGKLGAASSWYVMPCRFPWEALPHLNRDGRREWGGVGRREVGEEMEGEEGRETMVGM